MDRNIMAVLLLSALVLVVIIVIGLNDAFAPAVNVSQPVPNQREFTKAIQIRYGEGKPAQTTIVTNKRLFVRNEHRKKINPSAGDASRAVMTMETARPPDVPLTDATLIDPEHPEEMDLVEIQVFSPDTPGAPLDEPEPDLIR